MVDRLDIERGPLRSTAGINFYDPTVPTYDYNPAKAEALLDEMGLITVAFPTIF